MEVVKYDIETAVITALEAKYADIVVTDGKSKAVAMEGLAEYRGLRLKIDAKHKELKADALKYGQEVDAEKRRLKGLLEPGEQHIKDARQVYDDKIAAKKAEKDRIEQERIDNIQAKIEDLEKAVTSTVGLNSDSVASMCDAIVAIQITEEEFQEFTAKAKEVKLVTLSALDDIYNDKVTQEQEAAERKAEIEKIEKLRAEQAQEQTQIELAKAEFEKNKRDEQEKQDRAEFERKAKEQAEAQAKREAEQEKQRVEREKVEAEKEAERAEAVKPDKEKLIAFAQELRDIQPPVVMAKEAQKITRIATENLHIIAEQIQEQGEAL